MREARTSRGTVIGRYRPTGVGKHMRVFLYLHEHYAYQALARIRRLDSTLGNALQKSVLIRSQQFPAFVFHCLRFNLITGSVRFDEAPDFDTAREPHVGWWLEVWPSGVARKGHSDAIWHHRWTWVKDEYLGFDVAESRRWSAKYSPLIAGAPSGSARVFKEQLRAAGLS